MQSSCWPPGHAICSGSLFPHNLYLFLLDAQVFKSLSFDEDLRKPKSSEVDNKTKMKNSKKKKKLVEPNKLPASENKRSRREIISKTREEVLSFIYGLHFFKIEFCESFLNVAGCCR